MCSIFSKGIQPFNFIKHNIIQKLAYKVKYISQINGHLCFWQIQELDFFDSGLNCVQYGKGKYKKKKCNQHSSVFKVLR